MQPMVVRVVAVLMTLLSATPLLSQCNLTSVASVPFRSSILDLAIDGNDLWAATSYGIALYDRSADPPRLVAATAIGGTTRLVRVSNVLAYIGSGNALAMVRKSGRTLQVVRLVEIGAPINDLIVTTLSLYVATRNGIAQYDLLDPTNPTKTSATFQTSQPAVVSLATIGSTLYAADGDSSVEVFNISVPTAPQKIGTINAPPSAIAVHANNSKLFVSSPLQTTVFIGTGASMVSVGSTAFSATSFAPIAGDAVFAGGTDRTLRGIDFSVPATAVDIFREELAPTAGTVNRVAAVATASSRLYVGAGDIGLQTYDISGFSPPFPMRNYPMSAVSSVVSMGERFYVGRSNGVTEFTQTLIQARSWDGSRSDVVQDGNNNLLLTSSGLSVTLWTLSVSAPTAISTTNFRAPLIDAVMIGTTAYVLLNDRTLWSADLSQAAPTPTQISTSGIQPSAMARSGSSIALADAREDATTLVAYYPTLDFATSSKSVTIPGLATSGVALSNGTAAIQTFRGISLINFESGTVVLPQSNVDVARQLLLMDTTLLELTDSSLRVWNTQTQSVTAELTLPAVPVAMHVASQSTSVDIATVSGVMTVALDRITRMPALKPVPNGNAYYKKVAASSTRIYLFDSRGVDIYTNALHYIGAIRTPGIVDVAANDSGVFTLSSNLAVTAYSPDGYQRSSVLIAEGADAQPQSITTVNGAAWASIVRGCTTGGCEKKTIVFDQSLNQTGSMAGAVVDVVTSGTRAYAITDLPAEIRVINVADPNHPAVINSRAAEGTPVAIAFANGTVYVLGNTLAAYSEASLTKIGDILGTYSSDGTVTFADQRVRIENNCAIVTGRSFGPTLYAVGQQWSAQSTPGSPSAARGIVSQAGTMYIVTDHSLEIWSTAPLPKPPRRAPAR